MTTTTVSVKRYSDGRTLGQVEVADAEWEQYEAGEHPAYQWPEGIAKAGDVLTDEQIEEMGVESDTTVFLA